MKLNVSKRIWPLVLFGIGLSLIVGSIYFIANGGNQAESRLGVIVLSTDSTEITTAPNVGSRAPTFSIENVGGNNIGLEDFQGQVVLLNFWATWCVPCQIEMPFILDAYESAEAGEFTVLAVNDRESKQAVMGFANQFKLSFPLLLDKDGEVQRQYRVPGLPTSVFIDKDGIIQAIHIGILTEDQLHDYLEKAGLEL